MSSILESPPTRPRGPKRPSFLGTSMNGSKMSLRLARAQNAKIISELEVKDIEKFDQEYTLLEKIGQG